LNSKYQATNRKINPLPAASNVKGDAENISSKPRSPSIDAAESYRRNQYKSMRALLGDQRISHILVNPILQGVLLENFEATSQPNPKHTLYSALRRWWTEHERPWRDWGAQNNVSTVLEFGFDLCRRPTWLAENDLIDYIGIRREGKTAAIESKTRLIDRDWLSIDSLTPFFAEEGKRSERIPNWIVAVDVLDRHDDPIRLLTAIGNLYHGRNSTGHMLAVTRNPEFFGDFFSDLEAGLALKLSSRRKMRRLFRDAGFEILDEASPRLPEIPSVAEEFSGEEVEKYLLGIPPLHFWILRMHNTRTNPVEREEIISWLNELEQKRPQNASTPTNAPRNESAKLVLRTLLDNLKGVHWRTISSPHRLLAARNAGGRLFIVREGQLVAYHPDVQSAASVPVVRLTRDPNEITGELEVFSERNPNADRLYMMSLHAQGGAKEYQQITRALVIPASAVQLLMADEKVLGNPMLRDLRSKTLEAELGLRHNHSLKKKSKDKSAKKTNHDNPEETASAVWFVGRWGARAVPRSAIGQLACLLEQAVEFDREWGIPTGANGRVVFFSDFHGARVRQFGTDLSQNYNRQANAAVQYLEACGVIRALALSSQIASANTTTPPRPLNNFEPALPIRSPELINQHFKSVSDRAKASVKLFDIDTKLQTINPMATTSFRNKFIGNGCYVTFLIESEYLLRRFAMDLTQDLLDDAQFARESLTRSTPEILDKFDLEFVDMSAKFLSERIDLELGHMDSLGMKVF
jgi:hypothetical protein